MPRVLFALALVAIAYPTFVLLVGGEGAVVGAAIVGTVTVGVSLLAGVPLVLWFVKRAWFKFWQSAFAGLVLGAMVGVALNTFVELSDTILFVVKYTAIGGLHTATFWVLAFWKNRSLVGVGTREPSRARESSAA
jgi:hypothetical protein